ncbi:T9SS type A sorting domain-containing protein [Tenacibaculum agarivorans]|uniref:T9SS type A sorting domain-containing protein n=1 Tax=Tenacibaculum agarivorans TaxID=1908389 RepID=UPI00094BB8CB|nr:T9SS type A sorting domain-containing protein [Tenacibaculum agarivorans]
MKRLPYLQQIRVRIILPLILLYSLLTTAQNLDWVKSQGSKDDEHFVLTDLDNNGNVFTSGNYNEPFSYGKFSLPYLGNTDVFIEKRDSDGDLLWVKSLNTSNEMQVLSLSSTINGGVLIGGIYKGIIDADPSNNTFDLISNGDYDTYIIHLDSNGNLVWANSYGSIGADYLYAMAEDNTGDVILSILFHEFIQLSSTVSLTSPSDNIPASSTLIRIDSDANILWAYATGVTIPKDITFDNDNNIYIAGLFLFENNFDYKGEGSFIMKETGLSITGFPITQDGYIQKLDSEANFIWAKQLKNPYNTVIHSIAVDQEQNVYTSGVYQGSTSGIDFDPGPEVFSISRSETTESQQFIHKLNASGDFEWVTTFGPWYNTPDFLDPEQGGVLSLDNNNNLYYAGDVNSIEEKNFLFGNTTYTPILQDILLARLNTVDGAIEWSSMISGTGNENVYEADITDNAWVISGIFKENIDFTIGNNISFPVNSNGGSDFFVMKLDITATLSLTNDNLSLKPNTSFNIYPNPSSDIVNIENYSISSNFKVALYNIKGQLILTKETNEDLQIDIKDLPLGVYFININNEKKNSYISKLIKK